MRDSIGGIFHILTIEDVDDVICRFYTVPCLLNVSREMTGDRIETNTKFVRWGAEDLNTKGKT